MFAKRLFARPRRPQPISHAGANGIEDQRRRLGHAQIPHQFLVFVIVENHLVAAVE